MIFTKILLLAIVASLATAEVEIDSRIIQGHDAARGQFPFYVLIQIMVPQGMAGCGGSLLNKDWVMTAGHCVQYAYAMAVALGSLRANAEYEPGRKVFEIALEDIHPHPEFSLLPFAKNDIALIKLPQSAEFSDVIKPIPLACSANNEMDVLAIGNGITSNDAQGLSSILQYVELKTYSRLSCLKRFPFLIFRSSIICVKGEEHKSTCQGDSGGPLVTANTDHRLLGLTSFGSPSGCEVGDPQVFTRISYFKDWITQVTGVDCRD